MLHGPRHRHAGNLLAPLQDATFPEEAKLLDGFPEAALAAIKEPHLENTMDNTNIYRLTEGKI